MIPYFATPGYVNPVDVAARNVLVGSVLVALIGSVLLPLVLGMSQMVIVRGTRATPTQPPAPNPTQNTGDALSRAEEFNKINRRKLDL